MNTPIYNKLLALREEKRIPFHMPGHKRRSGGSQKKNEKFSGFEQIEEIDITEIKDYDNLHHPEGMIRQSMDALKDIYGTKESWYLVNGSTVGILAAISACCRHGDGILISRNCHKSVYNAIQLLQLKAYYFCPHYTEEYDLLDAVTEETLQDMQTTLQEHRNIRAVILPSPTYEGVVMDIAAIKETVKPFDVALIVDEAHGAHFLFHEYFPASAIQCGADIVIQSTHKTLPAMTQTALLHLCTDRIAPERISKLLSIYETSSPSYILLASAEYGVAFMNENVEAVQKYVDNLQDFREKCGQLQYIHLIQKEELCCKDYDRGKLVFSLQSCDRKPMKRKDGEQDGRNCERNQNMVESFDEKWDGGKMFDRLLQEYHIELEMADRSHCIAMTSVCDSQEMYEALFRALRELDGEIGKYLEKRSTHEEVHQKTEKIRVQGSRSEEKIAVKTYSEKILESWECIDREKEVAPFSAAAGRIAGDFVMLYPPGIPLLVPGEKIAKETVENIRYYIYNGYNVLGLSDMPGASGDGVSVLK